MTEQTKPKLALVFHTGATGDSPANGSCVMLGIVGVLEDTVPTDANRDWIVTSRTWCMEELDGRNDCTWNEFWVHYPELWERVESEAVHPSVVMKDLSDFLTVLSEDYDWYFVSWPAAFNWQWLKYTYDKYGPEDRTWIGYKAECMNGYENALDVLQLNKDAFFKVIYPTSDPTCAAKYTGDAAYTYAYVFLKMREYYRNYVNGR